MAINIISKFLHTPLRWVIPNNLTDGRLERRQRPHDHAGNDHRNGNDPPSPFFHGAVDFLQFLLLPSQIFPFHVHILFQQIFRQGIVFFQFRLHLFSLFRCCGVVFVFLQKFPKCHGFSPPNFCFSLALARNSAVFTAVSEMPLSPAICLMDSSPK